MSGCFLMHLSNGYITAQKSVKKKTYNRQKSNNAPASGAFAVSNFDIQICNPCNDWIVLPSSEARPLGFICKQDEPKGLSAFGKLRLCGAEQIMNIYRRVINKDVCTYLHIPHPACSIRVINKPHSRLPVVLVKALSIPLEVRSEQRVLYLIKNPLPYWPSMDVIRNLLLVVHSGYSRFTIL